MPETTYNLGEFVIGTKVRLWAYFRTTVDGVATLTDPTTAGLTITRPDGTTEVVAWPGTIVRTAVGTFRYDFTVALVGAYRVAWTGTGTAAVAAADEVIGLRA